MPPFSPVQTYSPASDLFKFANFRVRIEVKNVELLVQEMETVSNRIKGSTVQVKDTWELILALISGGSTTT